MRSQSALRPSVPRPPPGHMAAPVPRPPPGRAGASTNHQCALRTREGRGGTRSTATTLPLGTRCVSQGCITVRGGKLTVSEIVVLEAQRLSQVRQRCAATRVSVPVAA